MIHMHSASKLKGVLIVSLLRCLKNLFDFIVTPM